MAAPRLLEKLHINHFINSRRLFAVCLIMIVNNDVDSVAAAFKIVTKPSEAYLLRWQVIGEGRLPEFIPLGIWVHSRASS